MQDANIIDEIKGIKFTASKMYFALYLCKHKVFVSLIFLTGVIDTCKMLYPNHIKDIPITHFSCLSDEMLLLQHTCTGLMLYKPL